MEGQPDPVDPKLEGRPECESLPGAGALMEIIHRIRTLDCLHVVVLQKITKPC